MERSGKEEAEAMADTSERRRVARLTVPLHLSGPGLELRLVRLLDLSPEGARIEHLEPLREGVVCVVDLPPALGRLRLSGRVVWTGVRGGEQTLEGERRLHYQSGLAFTGVTHDQQAVLARGMETLKAERDATDRQLS
jgi:PilZ domain-containing protein